MCGIGRCCCCHCARVACTRTHMYTHMRACTHANQAATSHASASTVHSSGVCFAGAGSLPPEAAVQLAEVREKVEAARKEAAAADAAVSAVSAVYAARQEAADKAREMAANAGQRLKEYLSTLVSEHKPALQGSAPVTADAWPAVDGTAGPGGAAGRAALAVARPPACTCAVPPSRLQLHNQVACLYVSASLCLTSACTALCTFWFQGA